MAASVSLHLTHLPRDALDACLKLAEPAVNALETYPNLSRKAVETAIHAVETAIDSA